MELIDKRSVPIDENSRVALDAINPEIHSMDVKIQDLVKFELDTSQLEAFPLNELCWYIFAGDERVRLNFVNARLPNSTEELTTHVYPEVTYRRYCRRPKMCRFCRTEYARLGV